MLISKYDSVLMVEILSAKSVLKIQRLTLLYTHHLPTSPLCLALSVLQSRPARPARPTISDPGITSRQPHRDSLLTSRCVRCFFLRADHPPQSTHTCVLSIFRRRGRNLLLQPYPSSHHHHPPSHLLRLIKAQIIDHGALILRHCILPIPPILRTLSYYSVISFNQPPMNIAFLRTLCLTTHFTTCCRCIPTLRPSPDRLESCIPLHI
jgi:hypothetical protein